MVVATFNLVEKLIDPATVEAMNRMQVLAFHSALKKHPAKKGEPSKPLAQATVNKHMRTLKAALNWAAKETVPRMIDAAPSFPKLVGSSGSAKARAICGEELDRMIEKVESIVGEEHRDAWIRLLLERSNTASKIISSIGKAAGVVTARDASGKPKVGSSHDLRRSFAERWAPRVVPAVLKELMRHASIETTLRYYTGSQADATNELLFANFANLSETSSETSSQEPRPNRRKSVAEAGLEPARGIPLTGF